MEQSVSPGLPLLGLTLSMLPKPYQNHHPSDPTSLPSSPPSLQRISLDDHYSTMPAFLIKKQQSSWRQWLLVTLGMTLGFTLSQIHNSLTSAVVPTMTSSASTFHPQMKLFDDPALLASFAQDYHPRDDDKPFPSTIKPDKQPSSSQTKKKKDKPKNKKSDVKVDPQKTSSKVKDKRPSLPIEHDKTQHKRHHVHPQESSSHKKNKSNNNPASSNTTASYITTLDDPHTPQLLDFAIVGFAKCATSFMTRWLRQQKDYISISSKEVCHLNRQEPDELLNYLQHTLDGSKMRGFKCPSHFTRSKLNWYRDYFPKTKLIIGLRHPVWWLESFYTYRVRHPKHGNFTLPTDPNELMGRSCHSSFQGVCLERANFHQALARLAKTPLDPTEQALVHLPVRDLSQLTSRKVDNPVFVYEIRQVNDPSFAKDVADFLGLPHKLAPYVAKDDEDHRDDQKTQSKKVLDICQDRYRPLRAALMQSAREASQWIREYFLSHITVSSPETFVKLLQDWEQDPCDAQNKKAKES